MPRRRRPGLRSVHGRRAAGPAAAAGLTEHQRKTTVRFRFAASRPFRVPSAEPESGKKSGGENDPKTENEREREGHDEDEGDDEEALSDDFGASTNVPFPLRTPPHDTTAQERNDQALSQPVARAVPALTLGIGIALMGLGIGFLGLRLRRH